MSEMRNLPKSLAFILLLIITAMMATTCGGGSGSSDSQPTGRLSFQLQWDRTSSSRTGLERAGTGDCSDVATVTAAAYDTAGGLLQTGGPWPCGDHAGVLSQVPANRDVRVAIAGHDGSGATLYRGESSGTFYLPAGQSVNAGLITAGTFVAALTSPADSETVLITALTLAWNPVNGADHYVAQVADSSLFDAGSILQTLTVDASASPSCQPDTTAMAEDTPYYWRVQVVDGAGNTSPFSDLSDPRLFYISLPANNPPTATIVSPPVDYTHYYPDDGDIVCSGTATDLEDGNITDAANLQWQLYDPSGTVLDTVNGINPTFSYLNYYGDGTYTITFQVTDSDGASDTASITFVWSYLVF